MRVLVIGGTGYIGSAVYRHLAATGIAVDTVDRELRGNRVNERNLRCDFQELTPAFPR